MRSTAHTPDPGMLKNAHDGSYTDTKSAASTGDTNRDRFKIWFLYAADWIVVILAVVISQLILIPLPHSIMFLVTDPTIQQNFSDGSPVGTERVCVVLSTAVPTVIMVLWLGYFRRSAHEIHNSLLGLAMALSMCALFTSVYKQVGAILAPDFINKCDLSQDAFERSFRNNVPLSYRECQNKDIRRELRAFPSSVISVSSSSMGYLSLFLSLQMGLWLHPESRRQLRMIAPDDVVGYVRPGQTLVSFICLLPVAAGMTFAAIQTKYGGGGNGWGYAFSVILGYLFAIWGHVLYCSNMTVALILPPYR
ncbi:hypothetical protein H4R99_007675 [Coemansia sp. RSA 1722]|nr:hypothetical protein IWW45_007262 [Coemansia sp. RSA 485]KAJ2588800.1 hypothetical protein H4R99_007675 [Coemansia sp. RSA 1722]